MKKVILSLLIISSVATIGCSSVRKNIASKPNLSIESIEVVKPEPFDVDIKNNSLAISPDETMAVVSNSNISKIKIYDLKNKKTIKELDEFVTPRNIKFSKDGESFYVSDSSYGSVREFDSKTLKERRYFNLEKGAFGFTLTSDGKRMFVNNQDKSTVTVINLDNGKIEKVIKGFSKPRQGIVVGSEDKFIYVTNFKSNDIRVINAKTLEIEKTLEGIPAVRAISVNKSGEILYGASSSNNTINVIEISTGKVIKEIKVGNEPYGAALSPDEKTLLSGEKKSNQISVIDTETLEVKRTIEGLDEPRQAIVYSKNYGEAYVLNADLSISIINYLDGNIKEVIK